MKPDLSQLRDIHLPEPVSWWPPAPGWWLLLALTFIAVCLAYVIYARHRRNHWRGNALAELTRLRDAAPEKMLGELSVLMRRVAISRFPRQEVAALTGEDWLRFLDHTLGDGMAFQSGIGRVMLSGPYANDALVDTAALLALCEHWIKRLPAKGMAA